MRHLVRRFSLLLTCVAVATTARAAQAQDVAIGISDRAPRFYVNASPEPVAIDASRSNVLRRRISVDFSETKLGDALEAISRQSGLRLMYSWTVLPVDRRVTLKAEGISVAGALSEILLDAGVDVLFERDGQAAIVKRGSGPPRAAVGTVTGRVTDATTQQGVPGVRVSLEGTRFGTTTGSTGSYRLAGVAAGAYTLVTRRLGYKGLEQAVTVEDDREVVVNVTVQPVPSTLDEVVVTVTGEQRLRELGHVVGRINADSLVKEAPVSTLSELLTARVPGLQVFQQQGTVGGQVTLRIRGANTLWLGAEPIVIVDGVRYSTYARDLGFSNPAAVEVRSPLNDMNPNDIASIEVVKGPSAATLYGTDAANGVIVVTTKRGRPGRAQWNVYGRMATTEVATQRFPDLYWGWGTVEGVPNNTKLSCTLWRLTSGICTQQDSVVVLPNPLNDPEQSLFGSSPQWEYGASVAGGRQDWRYYFAGSFETQTSPVQMPPRAAEQLRVQRGLTELPQEWKDPNGVTNSNLRANVTATFGSNAELNVNGAYVHANTRSLAAGDRNPYREGVFQTTPNTAYGGSSADPMQTFLQTSTTETDRFLGSASGQWQPVSWLTTRATVGIDLGVNTGFAVVRRGDAPGDFGCAKGCVQDTRLRQITTSADFGTTAIARRKQMSARTSIGLQYVRSLYNGLGSVGSDLPPGTIAIGRASMYRTFQAYSEAVTLGGYAEETVGMNDRLFVTGALRVDGATAFGQDYNAVAYPKVGVSWIVSEEPFLPRVPVLNELRLRYAVGASGQQPTPNLAFPGFTPDRMIVNGAIVPAVRTHGLASADLRPERVREHEFGFDATLFSDRLPASFTWFRRRAVDQIVFANLPPGWGSVFTNVGLTSQRGFEALVTARMLDAKVLSWDVTFQHSSRTTKLIELGSSAPFLFPEGGWQEGYPLGARFQRPIVGYADANGDGILTSNEVQLGDSAVYVGESTPPTSQTVTAVLGMFERRFRVSALLERRSGFTQINGVECSNATCRAAVDPNAPLADQLEALQVEGRRPQPGDFTRLREVAVALELPPTAIRRLRLSSATLSLSARNVALWTKFKGPDPESAEVGRDFGAAGHVANGVPQSRSYVIRVDIK